MGELAGAQFAFHLGVAVRGFTDSGQALDHARGPFPLVRREPVGVEAACRGDGEGREQAKKGDPLLAVLFPFRTQEKDGRPSRSRRSGTLAYSVSVPSRPDFSKNLRENWCRGHYRYQKVSRS